MQAHDIQLANNEAGRVRVRNLEMAIRCWLFIGTDESIPESFDQAALWQRDEGGWLDLAAEALRLADDKLPTVRDRYLVLLKSVDTRRTSRSRRFGELLAAATEADSLGSCIGVEDAVETRIAPLAAQHPVFVLVLDGMSRSGAPIGTRGSRR